MEEIRMKKSTFRTAVALLSVAAAFCIYPNVTSAATDKLVVQDASGNTVFSVDDTGKVFSASPDTTFTQGTTATANDYTYSNQTAYSDANWAGGFYIAKRARGTSAAPAGVVSGDTIFTFDAQAWDGNDWSRGGQIMGKVAAAPTPGNGTNMTGSVPFYWTFRTTGTDGATAPSDRFIIQADGQITINDLANTYTNGSAYVCVNNSGTLFASETACP